MDRIKGKRTLACLLISFLPLFIGAGVDSKNLSIIGKEEFPKSRFQFVSVSPYDEVALGFSNGIVNIYNTRGDFLCAYQFPVVDPIFSVLFDNNESKTIKYYLKRSRKLLTFDREGNLLEEVDLSNDKESNELLEINEVDSQGNKYRTRGNKVLKIYPNGTEEVFYELYVPGEDIAAGVILIPICLYMVYKYGKKIFGSKKQYYSS